MTAIPKTPIKQNFMTDRFGFKFYETLPDTCVPAKVEDFYRNGELRIGMFYLIYSGVDKHYQVHRVYDIPRDYLQRLIDACQVYVLKQK